MWENQLGKFLTVEGIPVVEVVEVDRIADAAVVGATYSAANSGACLIAVDVASDCGIECGNRFGIEFGGVCLHPDFRLNVGGFGGDKGEKGFTLDAEAVEHHLIVAHAAAGVIRMEFTRSSE